jgi:uncharacterized protein (DUF58 family)
MKPQSKKRPFLSALRPLKWVLGALILLILAHATASGFVVYSLYAILLVMLLSRLIMEICLRGLVCEREISKAEAVIGEQVEIVLTIKNKGFLPIPWVLVEELLPEKMPITGTRARLLTLGPKQEEKMLYQVVLNRRGYHQIGPALIEAGDLFGFFRRYKTGAKNDFVTVYPAVEHIMDFDIAARRPIGPIKVTNKIFEDPALIFSVREYMPGDPFNRIHWKTTARTGTLHTKLFEPSRVIGSTLVLDLHRSGYRGATADDRSELAIMVAASFADYLSAVHEQVGLITNGRDLAEVAKYEPAPLLGKLRGQIIRQARKAEKPVALAPIIVPTRKSPEQGRLILETLARLDFTDGLTADKMLQHSIQHFNRDSTILVITPEVSDALAAVLQIIKEAGFLVNAFIIDNEPGYFKAVEKLAASFIDVYHIRNSNDIAKFATENIYY